MKKSKLLKPLLIILGVIIVVAIVYRVLSGRNTGDNPRAGNALPDTGLVTSGATGGELTPGVVASGTSAAMERSNELVILLLNVSSIHLDDAVFSNPAYEVLNDISTRLADDQNPGRDNPFLPIGLDTVGGTLLGGGEDLSTFLDLGAEDEAAIAEFTNPDDTDTATEAEIDLP